MKMDILLDSLHRYYDNKKNMTKLLNIIDDNENKISLRIIDQKSIMYTIHFIRRIVIKLHLFQIIIHYISNLIHINHIKHS